MHPIITCGTLQCRRYMNAIPFESLIATLDPDDQALARFTLAVWQQRMGVLAADLEAHDDTAPRV